MYDKVFKMRQRSHFKATKERKKVKGAKKQPLVYT